MDVNVILRICMSLEFLPFSACLCSSVLYNLCSYPIKGAIGDMLYWVIKEVRQNGNDSETSHGWTPGFNFEICCTSENLP